MATPTLRALRQHFGSHAHLVGVARPYVVDVLSGTSWLDTMISFDRRAPDPRLHSWAVTSQLHRLRLDAAILMTNSLRAAWIAACSRTPQRIGYVRYGRGPLLTRRLYPPRSGWRLTPISAVEYYLKLAAAVGADISSPQLELGTTEADDRHADQIWAKFDLGPRDTVVVLNSGGAYGSAKEWPTEHFAALAHRLASELGWKIVVVCGPIERPIAKRIVRLANCAGVFSLADEKVSLGLSKSIIKRSQLLISTDSGPRHFGAAFGIPTVTLFGPTDPRWSDNFNPRAIDLRNYVPCAPCGQRQCPLQHHRCLQDLSVEQVHRAALQLVPHERNQRVA